MRSVEDIILEGYCKDCDLDPVQCYNAGYCSYYDESEDDEDEL
jgi:hypothetical protein